jgi:hypothetical protein
MTLGRRHERRFGRAARSGLRSLLGGKGFPQRSQEDWVAHKEKYPESNSFN